MLNKMEEPVENNGTSQSTSSTAGFTNFFIHGERISNKAIIFHKFIFSCFILRAVRWQSWFSMASSQKTTTYPN